MVNPPSSEAERRLATYATDLSISTVPSPTLERAKLILLDTLGVCIRGAKESYGTSVVDEFDKMDLTGGGVGTGGRGATTFAIRESRPPTIAALVNASCGTALELDEGHQRSGHPGIHVIPPALAVAEHLDSSGTELLEAVIAGYETSARIGDLNRPLRDGLHPHGEWASIGGAVAVGLLLGQSQDTLTTSIRIAANPYLSVHWAGAYEGETVRNFYTGFSCLHGMNAAILAGGGVSGINYAIDRSLLTGTAKNPPKQASETEIIGTLGESYYIDDNYFKIHAACRYAHAPVEALKTAIGEQNIDPENVKKISVATFKKGSLVDETEPETALQAKFSTPYLLAAYIATGSTGPEVFTEDHLEDDYIRRICRLVEVSAESPYIERAQNAHWGASVTVETTSGDIYTGSVQNARGGPPNPHNKERILEKFDSLLQETPYATDSKRLKRRVLSIESVDSVRELL